MEFAKLLFWSSRPVSWINTAFPFAAAYLVVAGEVDTVWALGTLFFLFPYNLLMYGINDVFDYESDMQNPRKGGIEGSVLAPKWHKPMLRAAVLFSAPFFIALNIQGSVQANIVLCFLLFMVVAYSAKYLRFKEKPLLDSITSSTHFVGPMVYALVLVGWDASYWPYVIAFFFWGMASHAFGAVQDIVPDREANISSIATAWGARRVVWFASFLYISAGLLLMAQPWPVPLVGVCSWLYLVGTLPYMRIKDETSATAHNGWKRFMLLNMVTGFVITILIILHLR